MTDPEPMEPYQIEIADQQDSLKMNPGELKSIVRLVLEAEQVVRAEISIAIVDDSTMHELNRRHLNHDYPTDVLSFLLDRDSAEPTDNLWPGAGAVLDGEVIVSTDTAIRECARFGWSATNEFTLYLVHGLLHLCGYDDHSDEDREQMRSRERAILKMCGLSPNYENPDDGSPSV